MDCGKEKILPFTIVRTSRATLVEQVVAGIRKCILSGFYRPGDVLPATRDLAEAIGVSRIVTRAAFRELTREGLINPRPRIGSVVLGRGDKLWKGNVLLVLRQSGRTYYVNVFTSILSARLAKAGWLLTQVAVPPGAYDRPDLSALALHLAHPASLAVVMFDIADVEKMLSRAHVPFVAVGNKEENRGGDGCVGRVLYDRAAAAEELARAVAEAGVKRALQAGHENFDDVGAALKEAGVGVSHLKVRPRPSLHNPEAVAFGAYDAFARRIGRGVKMPDFIYFSDDYVCNGALAAFAAANIRIPEDIRIATWSNLGNRPVFAKDLTRMEMNPQGDAEKVADAIIAHLEGGSGAFPVMLSPAFRRGETL